MKRIAKTTLTVAMFTVALAACSKKETTTATTTQAAPPLPSDVQAVSAAATATTESTSSSGSTGASGSAVAEAGNGGTIVATGEFVSPVRSELAVKVPGRVLKMYVDEGSHVTKGQPLLELETEYVRLNLQKAEADTARARAMADDAAKDLERKKDLIAKDSIPRATYDRSQAAYEQAIAGRSSAQAQAGIFRQQLQDAVLRSPIEGVVAEKRTDVGQRLGDNTVAVVVAQTSPLKLRFRVPERYLASVHKGASVTATVDPYPGEKFEGHVTVVGGVIDPATRSLMIETEFPNRDGRLRPGLFARVEMQPGS